MLGLFARRKAVAIVKPAHQPEDANQAFREWRTLIVEAADGTEPDETELDRLEKLLNKTDEDFQRETQRIQNRRYVTRSKAGIPALVEKITRVRAEKTQGLEDWQAALVVIPEETTLRERLLRAQQLPDLESDVPGFLADELASNRAETSNLSERLKSLTAQRANVEEMLAEARRSKGRIASHVTATERDFIVVDAKIEELENALKSIDDEQTAIPKRLKELQSRLDKLMTFARRADAWLLLPQDIV